MNVLCLVFCTACLLVLPLLSHAREPLPATSSSGTSPLDSRPRWEGTGWRPFGDRKISVGFLMWGPRPRLSVAVAAKEQDKKPMPISRLKVTVLDTKGNSLAVDKHYDDGTMSFHRESHTGLFEVGTFVQNIQPKDVGTVSVAGFGGKVTVRFIDGNAQKEAQP